MSMFSRAKRIAALVTIAALAALASAVPASAAYSDADCSGATQSWANDPCAANQWGITSIDAPAAWATSTGTGAVVAVIDTGSDFNHPDLATNLISKPGSDVTKNTAYRCPFQSTPGNAVASGAIAQDDNGHGTHVAGTVAAVTNNARGVAAVAPNAKVLPVKVLDAEGSGTDEDVARGICFAVEQGAHVINLSLGYDPASSIIVSGTGAESAQAIQYAVANNVAVIAASGNEGFPACDFPGSAADTLCVGSVDRRDLKSYFSNFGLNIGLVAPGGVGSVFCEDSEDVYSTMWPDSQYDCGNNGYESLAGTSMATPHAAAVAALVVAQAGGKVDPTALYNRLKQTATDLGLPGNDPLYGSGKVNAANAVAGTPLAAIAGTSLTSSGGAGGTTEAKPCRSKKAASSTRKTSRSKRSKADRKRSAKRRAAAKRRASAQSARCN